MKILLTVDPEIPVPPVDYGGIERIVSGLSKAYSAAGHQVALLAHPSSTEESASQRFGWAGASAQRASDIRANALQLAQVARQWQPDIVHSFSRLLYLYPLLTHSSVRVVQSYQRAISAQSTSAMRAFARGRVAFTACGAHLFQNLPKPGQWTAIHNFTDTDYFRPDPQARREHLFFLGRVEPVKGPLDAIKVAQATGQKLVLAGNIPDEHADYFRQQILPLVDDKQIRYVGPVNDEQKRRWLQTAKALLFPIHWEEPFGIVMAESLACGTPVLAYNRGAVPEVIQNAFNGFKVANLTGMAQLVRRLADFDPQAIARDAQERFSKDVIAGQYLKIFHQMLGR